MKKYDSTTQFERGFRLRVACRSRYHRHSGDSTVPVLTRAKASVHLPLARTAFVNWDGSPMCSHESVLLFNPTIPAVIWNAITSHIPSRGHLDGTGALIATASRTGRSLGRFVGTDGADELGLRKLFQGEVFLKALRRIRSHPLDCRRTVPIESHHLIHRHPLPFSYIPPKPKLRHSVFLIRRLLKPFNARRSLRTPSLGPYRLGQLNCPPTGAFSAALRNHLRASSPLAAPPVPKPDPCLDIPWYAGLAKPI